MNQTSTPAAPPAPAAPIVAAAGTSQRPQPDQQLAMIREAELLADWLERSCLSGMTPDLPDRSSLHKHTWAAYWTLVLALRRDPGSERTLALRAAIILAREIFPQAPRFEVARCSL